jgi:hypothetical protein
MTPLSMVPEGGVASCPVCGGIDPTAATRPLFVAAWVDERIVRADSQPRTPDCG